MSLAGREKEIEGRGPRLMHMSTRLCFAAVPTCMHAVRADIAGVLKRFLRTADFIRCSRSMPPENTLFYISTPPDFHDLETYLPLVVAFAGLDPLCGLLAYICRQLCRTTICRSSAAGDFTVPPFRKAFYDMDAESGARLSRGKNKRQRTKWSTDAPFLNVKRVHALSGK